jgi:hypothetical protein
MVPTQRQALVASYNERAQALETDGRLREALEARKIALTVDPDNAAARDGLRAAQAKIDGLISQRLADGRAAQARGAQVAARRSFLGVLALDRADPRRRGSSAHRARGRHSGRPCPAILWQPRPR